MRDLYIVVNVDHFFLSHRLPIALAAKDRYRVTIVSRDTGCREEIESYGLNFIEVPFERSGTNILHELKCVSQLYKIYRRSPDPIIHHVTVKASIIGAVAARLAGRKNVVNAISGFGYSFVEGRTSFKQKIVKQALLFAFRNKNNRFILQNKDDVKQLKELGIKSKTYLIKGSGVDLSRFTFEPETVKDKVRVTFCARMLYDKGVVEFVEAARKIKETVGGIAEFQLAGNCDILNLAGIEEKALLKMLDGTYIKWLGHVEDVFSLYKDSDIIVLPSYREGLPKSLIEACAVGRPIITTDTTGCRECVVEGYNGYFVPVRDVDTLANRMVTLICDKEKREVLGRNGRTFAEKHFSIQDVIKAHLAIYSELES